jgi:hypothetical protein
MFDESGDFRKPPVVPYQAIPASLWVSENVITSTLRALRRAGHREAAVFWYGVRGSNDAQVKAVITPQQTMTRGNYHISPAAMSEMVSLLDADWKPLAQVHSHPGSWVEHSLYDDLMISSKRALSIIFPFYGEWSQDWPRGIGVHEWQNGYWHRLDVSLAARRVRLTKTEEIFEKDLRR